MGGGAAGVAVEGPEALELTGGVEGGADGGGVFAADQAGAVLVAEDDEVPFLGELVERIKGYFGVGGVVGTKGCFGGGEDVDLVGFGGDALVAAGFLAVVAFLLEVGDDEGAIEGSAF